MILELPTITINGDGRECVDSLRELYFSIQMEYFVSHTRPYTTHIRHWPHLWLNIFIIAADSLFALSRKIKQQMWWRQQEPLIDAKIDLLVGVYWKNTSTLEALTCGRTYRIAESPEWPKLTYFFNSLRSQRPTGSGPNTRSPLDALSCHGLLISGQNTFWSINRTIRGIAKRNKSIRIALLSTRRTMNETNWTLEKRRHCANYQPIKEKEIYSQNKPNRNGMNFDFGT